MRKFTKATAATLALVSAISVFTGCGEETQSGAPTSSGAETTTPVTALQPELQTNSGVQEAVSNVSVDESYKDIEVTTKPIWMAWWEIQEATPAVEMFKTLYGTPATKPEGFDHVPDENVFCNIMITSYGDRYVNLAKQVTSDDSPDCFPFEICYYPYGVYQNLFQPVDDLFDFDSDDWADYKEVIDMFEWDGKNYCPIMDLSPNSLLWYRKTVVEEAGLEDPWELFDKGEWTWDVFMEMCREFADPDNSMYAIDGYSPAENIVATTGKPFIGLEDGKLVSNLYDANLEKAMNMMAKFDDSQENLKYPKEILNNWAPNYKEWMNGKVLFFQDGTWRYEEHWQKFKKAMKWDDDEINFVPFPRMEGSDEYYQAMKQDAIMFVAGSKNPEGYKAWIYANLVATKDPDVKSAGRQQSIENYDWTEELLDRLDKVKDPDTFVPVFDFKNGIGPDIADTMTGENPVGHLTGDTYNGGESYTSVREANQGVIVARIEELNAKVS